MDIDDHEVVRKPSRPRPHGEHAGHATAEGDREGRCWTGEGGGGRAHVARVASVMPM